MKVQKFDRLKFIATLNTIKKYPVGESDEGGIESMIHTDEENFRSIKLDKSILIFIKLQHLNIIFKLTNNDHIRCDCCKH